uniref:Putative ovule protein n=1 Tax=Solanum chacoense TaxID=4108 RepID=A0A0V0GHJ2_SOLCH
MSGGRKGYTAFLGMERARFSMEPLRRQLNFLRSFLLLLLLMNFSGIALLRQFRERQEQYTMQVN